MKTAMVCASVAALLATGGALVRLFTTSTPVRGAFGYFVVGTLLTGFALYPLLLFFGAQLIPKSELYAEHRALVAKGVTRVLQYKVGFLVFLGMSFVLFFFLLVVRRAL